MIYKQLLLITLLTSPVYAEQITLHTPSITGEQAPELLTICQPATTTPLKSRREIKREQKQLKKQEPKVSPDRRSKRRWGIALGVIGFFVLATIPLLLFSSCVGNGLANIK